MPRRSTLDIEALDERSRARLRCDRTCKGCGEAKPATEFGPHVICAAKRGTSYVVFRAVCNACRAAQGLAERQEMRRHAERFSVCHRITARAMARQGHTNAAIAARLKCTTRTLQRHFAVELREGRERFAEWGMAA